MVAQQKKFKIDFSSFWHDHGFGGNFFLVRIQSKSIWKLIFPAILGIVTRKIAFWGEKRRYCFASHILAQMIVPSILWRIVPSLVRLT